MSKLHISSDPLFVSSISSNTFPKSERLSLVIRNYQLVFNDKLHPSSHLYYSQTPGIPQKRPQSPQSSPIHYKS
jgi:hypothetical protein